jgi:hypothetical protein
MHLINEPIPMLKSLEDQPIYVVYKTKPLIYDDFADTTIIHNILLIDDTVKDYDLFVKGSNLITFPIVYNYHSDRNELKTLLLSKFNNIDRIAFVFHNSNMYTKQFLNNQEFFCMSDSVTNTDNVNFIIDTINDLNVSHVDFLACNSLEYDIWIKYYNILQTQTKTNLIIGASNDATGNIKYGGDWIMETTNEDIKNIYFNELIDNYTHTLATIIPIDSGLATNNNIYIKQLSNNSIWYSTTNNSDDNTSTGSWTRINANVDWQIRLSNTNITKTETNRLKLTLLTDIIINNVDNCLIINTDYITIDGNNKTIVISSISNYPGLIQNGTGNSSAETINTLGKNNITIQNINSISSTNSTLAQYGGWICQAFYGNTSSGINTISNCTNNNGIITFRSGGIGGGSLFAFSTGTNTIINCTNTGEISGRGCGGITGRIFAQSSSGTNTITNCANNGNISGPDSGGITGDWFGYNSSGTNTITNCANNGNISGSYSGGITGANIAYTDNSTKNPSVTISNCYSVGTISTTSVNSGGICAGYDTTDGTYATISSVTISNCYTLYGLIKAPVQSDKVTFNISNIYEANGEWSTIKAITAITNNNLLYKRNNLYVWAYSKGVSNIDQLNSPFILYSINPSNNPVTNFTATELKAVGITATYLRSFNFTEYELLFVGFSIVDLIPEIDTSLKKLQDDLLFETNRAKEIENELIKDVNKLNLVNPMWVQKMNKFK